MQKFIFQRISPSLLSFEFDENEIHTYMARFHTFDNFYANQAFGTQQVVSFQGKQWSCMRVNVMRIFSSFMTCFVVVAVCKVHFEIEKVQSIVLNDEKNIQKKI